jgi:hypothetical protein
VSEFVVQIANYLTKQKLSKPEAVLKNENTHFMSNTLYPVLYGCETWSLTLWEEHRLRVFENKVLRRIYGPKRDELMGGWRNCIMRSFKTCTFLQV